MYTYVSVFNCLRFFGNPQQSGIGNCPIKLFVVQDQIKNLPSVMADVLGVIGKWRHLYSFAEPV